MTEWYGAILTALPEGRPAEVSYRSSCLRGLVLLSVGGRLSRCDKFHAGQAEAGTGDVIADGVVEGAYGALDFGWYWRLGCGPQPETASSTRGDTRVQRY
jgi:hypothetical protein